MMPNYVKTMDELELMSGAIDAIVRLSASGRDVFVVTNQSAIGRGLVDRETVDDIHRHLEGLVRARGGRIRAFLVCPHTPEARCDCRKPAPGLILQTRDRFGVDLGRTVLVGDQPSDVEAASAAGCDAILIGADGPAPSLTEAAELICAA